MDETKRVFAQYACHPDAAPGRKHLINLSKVDGVEALAIVGCRERHIVDLAAEVTGR